MAFSPFCLFLSLLLLLLPFSSNAQTRTNISLGSSITAGNRNSFWASPSGDFAFGFQQIANEGFLLAIWFNKIPQRTIVWFANGDGLVPTGSTVQLTSDGQLVLTDRSGSQVWNAATSGTGASYAAMLDTGNFVLARNGSDNLWESFDEPKDTILPTQTMNQNTELFSRYLETNFSMGRYKFILQGDGNLLLYTTNYPFPDNQAAYWSTQSSIGSGYQVIFNQSGFVYLISKNGTILNYVFSDNVSGQFYQRATVGPDGVFRHYSYPKNSSSRTWPISWTVLSFEPSNICVRANGETGGGVCGFNSYCRLENDQDPECLCPPGYDFLDPNDVRQGCKPTFSAQDCDGASQETDAFDFREMLNADWPGSDYESYGSVSEDWCRQACSSDCYCDVAIFRDQKCWMKRMPLSFGRVDPGTGGKALIKVRKNKSASATKKEDETDLILAGSVLLGSSVFVNILLIIAAIAFFYCLNRPKTKNVDEHKVIAALSPQYFTYTELESATEGFKEELGNGAFGTVYKGFLKNTEVVAVKRLHKMVTEGEQEFETEVRVIGGTNHKNLVKLLGFCNEGQHRLLMYEYMSNGSLANFLFGNSRPDWCRRMQIAFGIARGLLYLHEECSFQIIHCDIKPQNILLDESLTARISDFGLAKLLKTDQTRTTTKIRGTRGYVAPEWFKNMPVTATVDVYSFGVLLLELVCCRRSFEMEAKEENQVILADWAYDCYKEGAMHLLVEKDEEALDDMIRVKRFVMVALWCIQEDPSLRPAMKKVIMMLEGAVQVPVPPDPVSFISSI